jgi:septum formation protein
MKVVLASKSPRRKELLSNLFKDFEIITKETDESVEDGILPKVAVEILALRKGLAVADLVDDDTLVISSDTLVEINNIPLGKPVDKADAYAMLKTLSGTVHNVHTGVAVRLGDKVLSGVATTAVHFKNLTDEQICDYVESGEPMDKAGAYGIQGKAGEFVIKIDGDFDTVVGLSMALTKALCEQITGMAL